MEEEQMAREPGWYDDPEGSDGERWWDGKKWGNTVLPKLTSTKAVDFPIPVSTPKIPQIVIPPAGPEAEEDESPADSIDEEMLDEAPEETTETTEPVFSGLDAERLPTGDTSKTRVILGTVAALLFLIFFTAVVSFFMSKNTSAGDPAPENTARTTDYTGTIKTNFIDSCVASADSSLTAKKAKSLCSCAYESLNNANSFADFAKIDEIAARSLDVLSPSDVDLLKESQKAISSCKLKLYNS